MVNTILNMPKVISLRQLMECYLIDCDGSDLDFMLGIDHSCSPTLIGWVKYWRQFTINHPDVAIIHSDGSIWKSSTSHPD